MSGIGGIYQRDGRPVNQIDLDRIAGLLAVRGRDETGRWSRAQVGLVHTMLRTTPESLHEHQPLTSQNDQVVGVMDGRLDYRAELQESLASHGYRPRDSSDAELLLGAYLHWGRDCVKHLAGDFAFAVWDARKQHIFCGRDHLGIRSFYYHLEVRTFAWASDLPSLLSLSGLRIDPNLGMVAEHLANAVTSREETLYLGINRLPPAHTLTVDADGSRKIRYWDPQPSDETQFESVDDTADHLRELATEAVRYRLRSIGPVACELSGGLDSSSVTGVAASLLHDDKGPALRTISSGLDPHEEDLVDTVAAMWRLEGIRLPTAPAGEFDFAEHVRRFRDFPTAPSTASALNLWGAAAASGCRVVLSGEGPDEWFTGSPLYLADLLRHGRLTDARRQVMAWSQPQGRSSKDLAWKFGVRPLLVEASPTWLRGVVRARRGQPAPWLTPEFYRRTHLSDRLLVPPSAGKWSHHLAKRGMYEVLQSGYMAHALEWSDRITSWCGVDRRMPFGDVKIVNFAFALDESHRSSGTAPKALVRRAMHDVLPTAVRLRTNKGNSNGLTVSELLSPWCRELLNNLTIERQGWIDGDKVRTMVNELDLLHRRGRSGYSPHIFPLWGIIGVETWFRAGYGGSRHSPKRRGR